VVATAVGELEAVIVVECHLNGAIAAIEDGVLWRVGKCVVARAVFDGAGYGFVEIVGLEVGFATGFICYRLHGALIAVMFFALLRPLRALGLGRGMGIRRYGGIVGSAELRGLPQAARVDR